MKKYIILSIFLFLILSNIGFAIRIYPAYKDIEFIPNSTFSGSVTVHNREDKVMNMKITIRGDLIEYLKLSNKNDFTLNPGERKTMEYKLEFPYKLKPGESILRLGATQKPPENVPGISVTVGVESLIKVFVQYPPKYVEPEMSISENVTNNIRYLNITVHSRGNETVTAHGKLEIYNYFNSSILSEDIEEIKFEPKSSTTIQKTINTTSLTSGIYRSFTSFRFEDMETFFENEFLVGEPEIEILDIQRDIVKEGEIGNFSVKIKNNYMGKLSKIFITLHMSDRKSKTDPIEMDALENSTITTDFNTRGLKYGIYKSNLEVFYNGYSIKREIKIYVLPENIEEIIFISVFILIIIIITTLLIHFRDKL